MPQRKTAKKELKKNKKRHDRNLHTRKQIASVIKKFKKTLENNDTAGARTLLNDVYKILDKAATKKIIHPNKAARKKSRLTSLHNKQSSR